MGSSSGSVSRARWVAVFTLVLIAVSAVPVLADSPKIGVGPARVAQAPATDGEAQAPVEETQPPEAIQPPTEEAIAEEVEAHEREELAKNAWLESPEAIHQREESRTAYDDLSTTEAEGVLGSVFQEALKQLDGDPARILSDLQIEEVLSENGALVPNGEGGSELRRIADPDPQSGPGEGRQAGGPEPEGIRRWL